MPLKYGPKLMKCPRCEVESYHTRDWNPVATPSYKNEEVATPILCREIVNVHYFCLGVLEIVWGSNIDLLPDSFEIDMEMFGDGSDKRKVRVHSLQELRTIENESLRRAANGEGKPLIWRDLSQDRSNRDVHTLRNTPHETGRSKPLERRHTRSGLPITGAPMSAEELD